MRQIIQLFCLLIVSNLAWADIRIAEESEIRHIGSELSVYSPKQAMDVNSDTAALLFQSDDVFIKNDSNALVLQNAEFGYWVKGKILSAHISPRTVVLRFESSYLGHTAFFIKNDREIVQTEKSLTDSILAYDFIIETGDNEFLVYLDPEGVSHSPSTINIHLYQLNTYDKNRFSEIMFFFVLFGFIAAMFAYNLILYLYVGYKPYLYYCAYLAALFVLDYVGTGMGAIGVIELSYSTSVMLYSMMPGIAILFLIQFGRSILNLNEHYPKINNVFKYGQIIWVLCIPLTLTEWKIFNLVLLYVQVSAMLLMAVIAYLSHRDKHLPGALIFCYSFVFLLTGSILQLSIGFLPYQDWGDIAVAVFQWSDHYLFHLFTMIEMLLLSIALATFIRQAEKDKQYAQDEKLKVVEQSLVLKKQYSDQLEIDVRLRTNELNQKNIELENLHSLRDRFFSYITHEFRSPLTLAIGPLSEISNGKFGALTKPLKNAVDLAERNTKKMLNLVNLMLDLARKKNSRMYLSIKKINVTDSISDVIIDHSYALNDKNIELTTHTKINQSYSLWFDNYYFDSIFTNLLTNACKHTPQGGKIDLTYSLTDDYLQIDILNSGSYIVSEQQTHIFESFYKQNGSESRDDTNSGIGLALVKEFLDVHEGTISIASSEQSGTCFTVKLKLGKQHLEQENWLEHDFDFIAPSHTPMLDSIEGQITRDVNTLDSHDGEEDKTKILLVDDNEELRLYLAQILIEAGYQVVMAEDGEQGYLACQSEIPDVLVSDVNMPNVSGLELINRVRLNEDLKDLPIILLTSESSKSCQIEGIEKGADYYLTKPFVPRELLAHINRIYQHKQILKEKYLTNNVNSSALISSIQKEDIQSRSLAIIYDNISDPDFNVERLAEQLYMDRSTLHRQLKETANITANKLILDARLKLALDLLATNSRLIDIAYAVGFNSQSYFSRKFSTQYHCTPSEWRKKNQTHTNKT